MMAVRRFLRILFNILTVASLALCLATVLIWVRSASHWDTGAFVAFGQDWHWSSEDGSFDINNQWHLIMTDLKGGVRDVLPLMYLSDPRFIEVTLYYRWVTTGTAIMPLAWICARWWRRRRRKPGHCPECGYDLRATPDRCPECGAVSLAKDARLPKPGEPRAATDRPGGTVLVIPTRLGARPAVEC
jgi:hypothetical protein